MDSSCHSHRDSRRRGRYRSWVVFTQRVVDEFSFLRKCVAKTLNFSDATKRKLQHPPQPSDMISSGSSSGRLEAGSRFSAASFTHQRSQIVHLWVNSPSWIVAWFHHSSSDVRDSPVWLSGTHLYRRIPHLSAAFLPTHPVKMDVRLEALSRIQDTTSLTNVKRRRTFWTVPVNAHCQSAVVYFYYFLRCRWSLKTWELWNNTHGIMW